MSPAPDKDRPASSYPDYVNFPFPFLNDACPPGHFCTNGSDPEPCPSGTFHNEGGISNKSQCHPCPVGRYCNGSGTLNGTAPPCDAGYVCTGGSSQPKPIHRSMGYICPRGFFCPTGNYFLKVPLRANCRFSFFYIFVYNTTFFVILPNFNPLRTLEVIRFFTFISENLQPPYT